ncbi:MAG: hypothetical protein GQ570_01710 [Helicobacteraceae bacterium]|nr:hypothetical protein [Helicobacteraceae bacterium]
MKLVFIHGWSVTSTATYGNMPSILQKVAPKSLDLEVENIYLGEYISFSDEVTLHDIARAFESARLEKLQDQKFACVTHSTGAVVVRLWLDLFFKNNLRTSPLSHLVMLAPANHGSALAILGKSRVGRLKAWVDGVEAGVKVLEWLQLGSEEQWELNSSWLEYTYTKETFFPFVLSGEKIDEKFYDFINSYLVEKGSDGVVRLAATNLNYKKLKLVQNINKESNPLELEGPIRSSAPCPFEIVPNASHSGEDYGIMQSAKKSSPAIRSILKCLEVSTNKQYKSMITKSVGEFVMFIFNIKDNYGNKVEDYDMLLLAGDEYLPSQLPKNFYVDKQKNNKSKNLVYYLNCKKLRKVKNKKLGIKIVPRPDKGFVHYKSAEFKCNSLDDFLVGNQSVMIEVVLQRVIDRNTFVLDEVGGDVVEFGDRGVNNSKGQL